MAGMKVTLSAAMRARDVSRPRPDDEAAAEQAEARRESGGGVPPSAGGTPQGAGGQARPDTNRENNARPREDGGNRGSRPARKGAGSGGRPRRKRR
jgi:hypothetical protein